MADQMPAAPRPARARVRYGAAAVSIEPPGYGPPLDTARDPGMGVMDGVAPGNAVQESGYAHDMNAGLVTPFYGGSISPIQAHGDADAGGREDVADSVAGAGAAASARGGEAPGGTERAGSTA